MDGEAAFFPILVFLQADELPRWNTLAVLICPLVVGTAFTLGLARVQRISRAGFQTSLKDDKGKSTLGDEHLQTDNLLLGNRDPQIRSDNTQNELLANNSNIANASSGSSITSANDTTQQIGFSEYSGNESLTEDGTSVSSFETNKNDSFRNLNDEHFNSSNSIRTAKFDENTTKSFPPFPDQTSPNFNTQDPVAAQPLNKFGTKIDNIRQVSFYQLSKHDAHDQGTSKSSTDKDISSIVDNETATIVQESVKPQEKDGNTSAKEGIPKPKSAGSNNKSYNAAESIFKSKSPVKKPSTTNFNIKDQEFNNANQIVQGQQVPYTNSTGAQQPVSNSTPEGHQPHASNANPAVQEQQISDANPDVQQQQQFGGVNPAVQPQQQFSDATPAAQQHQQYSDPNAAVQHHQQYSYANPTTQQHQQFNIANPAVQQQQQSNITNLVGQVQHQSPTTNPQRQNKPRNIIDPVTYNPILTELPVSKILPKDFVPFSEPPTLSTYDAVPCPSFLRSFGKAWNYVPKLGTQFVATLLYTVQSFISYYDRDLKYPTIYPYYYLLRNYGPMVRLDSPLGANILILAVNGQDFPFLYVPRQNKKRLSFFDSLNAYRKNEAAVLHSEPLDKRTARLTQFHDNTVIRAEQFYPIIQSVTDNFLKRTTFLKGHSGDGSEENHENDLFKWSLQCTMEILFKGTTNVVEKDEGQLVENLYQAISSVRLCETGIQLWRTFSTFAWSDLVEAAKLIDRTISNEASRCVSQLNKGAPSGCLLESLVLSGELDTEDLLTPLLDLLLINVNVVVNTTGFLLHNLGKAPQVQRNLYRELVSVMPLNVLDNQHLSSLTDLKYLKACITETLRVAPPFPVLGRQLKEDTLIHGYTIPKGTFVQMVNVLPCSRGDHCYDELGKFQPERWAELGNVLGGDPLAGLPQWTSSPTLNRDLVSAQISYLLAKVVREYRIEFPMKKNYSDGAVLGGPTSTFNFSFIER